jgi:hypothetical protein
MNGLQNCWLTIENQNREADYLLIIRTDPVRGVTINVSDQILLYTGTVISCSANASPIATSFTWKQMDTNNQLMTVASTKEFLLNSTGNFTVKCSACNEIRKNTYCLSSSTNHIQVLSDDDASK